MTDWITIPCEGSGLPAYDAGSSAYGICYMCGAVRVLEAEQAMSEHYRRDIVAMKARGDFDA